MSVATISTARAEQIRGWMSAAELRWLATRAGFAHRVVEVGSFAGRSARAIGDHLGEDATLLCVDPLDPTRPGGGLSRVPPGTGAPITTLAEGDAIYEELCDNLTDLIAAGRVTVMRAASLEVAAALLQSWGPQSVDFVFLDGDHARGQVAADIEAWLPLVAYGGYIAGHDYYDYETGPHPGVKAAVDARFPDCDRPAGSIWCAQVGA